MKTKQQSIQECLDKYGFKNLDEASTLCKEHNIDVDAEVKGIQPIAFDNAVDAYTLGVAIALKNGSKDASVCAELIGEGLKLFVNQVQLLTKDKSDWGTED